MYLRGWGPMIPHPCPCKNEFEFAAKRRSTPLPAIPEQRLHVTLMAFTGSVKTMVELKKCSAPGKISR